MESAEVLQSIAEVGIALAGFGGIAAGLGYRARGVWSEEDRVRLVGMATASLVVVFASFLPYAIASLGFSATWRAASAILLLFQISSLVRFLPVFVRNVRTGWAGAGGGYSRTAGYLLLGAQFSALVLLIVASLGAAPGREFGFYLTSLLLILFVASVLFVRLLVASFRDDRPAA